MSLYLGIFDGDDELDGWVLGSYSDFGCFRDTIASKIADAFEVYPNLMQHSDCDGEWSDDAVAQLRAELEDIGRTFRGLPPEEPTNAFKHTADFRQDARSLYDCFYNVDGENLFEAFIQLCEEATRTGKPIALQ